jgi:hypothetical protein
VSVQVLKSSMSAVHLVLRRPRISMQLPRMGQNTESSIAQPGNSDLRQRMHALGRTGCYLAVLLSALNSLVNIQRMQTMQYCRPLRIEVRRQIFAERGISARRRDPHFRQQARRWIDPCRPSMFYELGPQQVPSQPHSVSEPTLSSNATCV